jgi:hypothetical protein
MANRGMPLFFWRTASRRLTHSQLPVWGYIFALIIAVIFIVPSGMIQAITNQTIGLNVLSEFIIGYCLPGRPVAMMVFKSYCFFTVAQGNGFVTDLS